MRKTIFMTIETCNEEEKIEQLLTEIQSLTAEIFKKINISDIDDDNKPVVKVEIYYPDTDY